MPAAQALRLAAATASRNPAGLRSLLHLLPSQCKIRGSLSLSYPTAHASRAEATATPSRAAGESPGPGAGARSHALPSQRAIRSFAPAQPTAQWL